MKHIYRLKLAFILITFVALLLKIIQNHFDNTIYGTGIYSNFELDQL